MPKRAYARRSNPKELDEDMRPADLIDTLERLRFTNRPSVTLRLDRGVRDYMVRILRERR